MGLILLTFNLVVQLCAWSWGKLEVESRWRCQNKNFQYSRDVTANCILTGSTLLVSMYGLKILEWQNLCDSQPPSVLLSSCGDSGDGATGQGVSGTTSEELLWVPTGQYHTEIRISLVWA